MLEDDPYDDICCTEAKVDPSYSNIAGDCTNLLCRALRSQNNLFAIWLTCIKLPRRYVICMLSVTNYSMLWCAVRSPGELVNL